MQNKSVLVIEDEKSNMKLFREVLKIGNYQVIEAPDAEKGIRLARQHCPDLILMDIQLPGMDGLTATKIIKDDPMLKDTPVVALTGFSKVELKDKAMEDGFAGYITKPINITRVLEDIAFYLGKVDG